MDRLHNGNGILETGIFRLFKTPVTPTVPQETLRLALKSQQIQDAPIPKIK